MLEAVKNTKMRMRSVALILGLVLATFLTVLFASQKAEAHGTDYPYHQSRYASCSDYYNKISANFPSDIRSWYSDWETVYRSPDLYKWNGYQWKLVDSSWPWYHNVGSPEGLRYYWQTPKNYQVVTPPGWNYLAPGYYRIKQFYAWESYPSYQHPEWQTFSSGSLNCRIT
jgi:hypothetical protein